MPLKSGSSRATVSENISEFHTGKTYAHTAAKFGKKRADKQAIAAALSNARRHPSSDTNDEEGSAGSTAPVRYAKPKRSKR